LSRDLILDFVRNRRQVVSSKGTSERGSKTIEYDDLTDYLRGQEDILSELSEKVRKGEFDVEVPPSSEPEPDYTILKHIDENKLREDARETIRGMGLSPVEPR
jgi:hypothetical protein